jgi:hypothetical protein
MRLQFCNCRTRGTRKSARGVRVGSSTGGGGSRGGGTWGGKSPVTTFFAREASTTAGAASACCCLRMSSCSSSRFNASVGLKLLQFTRHIFPQRDVFAALHLSSWDPTSDEGRPEESASLRGLTLMGMLPLP